MNGYLWKKIKEAYEGDDVNAFKQGCSKETMAYIVNRSGFNGHTEKVIRECLNKAVSEGVMYKGRNPKTNYTTFIMDEDILTHVITEEFKTMATPPFKYGTMTASKLKDRSTAEKIETILADITKYRKEIGVKIERIEDFTDDIDSKLDDLQNSEESLQALVETLTPVTPPGKLFREMKVGEKGIILTDIGDYKGQVVVRTANTVVSVDDGCTWTGLKDNTLRVGPCSMSTSPATKPVNPFREQGLTYF